MAVFYTVLYCVWADSSIHVKNLRTFNEKSNIFFSLKLEIFKYECETVRFVSFSTWKKSSELISARNSEETKNIVV